jgi:hypothetical protein
MNVPDLINEASDPSLPPARAREIHDSKGLSDADRRRVMEALARNPNLTDEMLARLALTYPAAASENPAFVLAALDGYAHLPATFGAAVNHLGEILRQVAQGSLATRTPGITLENSDKRPLARDLCALLAEETGRDPGPLLAMIALAERPQAHLFPAIEQLLKPHTDLMIPFASFLGNLWEDPISMPTDLLRILASFRKLQAGRGMDELAVLVRWSRKLRPYQPWSWISTYRTAPHLRDYDRLFRTMLAEG